MYLICFRDNTYGRSYCVSAEDLTSAVRRHRRVVALRHPDGVKIADDGRSLRRGTVTVILLSYIPLSARNQAEAMLVGSMMDWDCPGAQPSCDLHAKAAPYTGKANP
jgi:hypothetical protein